MTASVHNLPQVDQCPNCDAALASRRGIFSCGYCGSQYERAPDSTITARDGTVRVCRVWWRIKGGDNAEA